MCEFPQISLRKDSADGKRDKKTYLLHPKDFPGLRRIIQKAGGAGIERESSEH